KSGGLESRAVEQRLDLVAMRYEALGQAQSLGFARVQAVAKQFEIGGRYVHEIQREHSTGPIVRVPIPLFDFGQGVKARGEAKLRQLQQRYLGLAEGIRSDVRVARERFAVRKVTSALCKQRGCAGDVNIMNTCRRCLT